jgi:hypothetical protein
MKTLPIFLVASSVMDPEFFKDGLDLDPVPAYNSLYQDPKQYVFYVKKLHICLVKPLQRTFGRPEKPPTLQRTLQK